MGKYKDPCQMTMKKAKSAPLQKFIRLTGYHQETAVRLPNAKPVREVLVCQDGKPVKRKPEKQRPANRKRERRYAGEIIGTLHLVRTFFWYKYGWKRRFRGFLPPSRAKLDPQFER
ncbi:MAG: hypothetical protein LBF77_09685 [Spirochaetaceae bacterium]|jgi:hypothetical protein|nr:hypothetical protein [Spirochaetaceae bacterium]